MCACQGRRYHSVLGNVTEEQIRVAHIFAKGEDLTEKELEDEWGNLEPLEARARGLQSQHPTAGHESVWYHVTAAAVLLLPL